MPHPYGLSPPHQHHADDHGTAGRPVSPGARRRPRAATSSQQPQYADAVEPARRRSVGRTLSSGRTSVARFHTLLRLRPMLPWEAELCAADGVDPTRPAIETTPDGELLLVDPMCLSVGGQGRLRSRKRYDQGTYGEMLWSFSEDTSAAYYPEAVRYFDQAAVHAAVCRRPGHPSTVDRLFEGVNQCVIACGASCTGKTHTVIGTADDGGLLGRLLDELVLRAPLEEYGGDAGDGEQMAVSIVVECVRVWKEGLEDMLGHRRGGVQVKIGTEGQYRLEGAAQTRVRTQEDAARVLQRVRSVRPACARPEPDRHNRSALVVRVHVVQETSFHAGDTSSDSDSQSARPSSVTLSRRAVLTLADLGGGGGKAPGETAQDVRLASMAAQAVSRVLGTLADREPPDQQKRSAWASEVAVPYRESVLTQLLQDELGGNCQTTVICCLSPCHRAHGDAATTADLARRAVQAWSRPIPNVSRKLQELERRAVERRKVVSHIHEASADVAAVRSQLRDMLESINVLTAEEQALKEHKRSRHQEVGVEQEAGQIVAEALFAQQRRRREEIPALERRIRDVRMQLSAIGEKQSDWRAKLAESAAAVQSRRAKLLDLQAMTGRLQMLTGGAEEADPDPVPPPGRSGFEAAAEAARAALADRIAAVTAKRALDEDAAACVERSAQTMLAIAEAEAAADRAAREAARLRARLPERVASEAESLLAHAEGTQLGAGVCRRVRELWEWAKAAAAEPLLGSPGRGGDMVADSPRSPSCGSPPPEVDSVTPAAALAELDTLRRCCDLLRAEESHRAVLTSLEEELRTRRLSTPDTHRDGVSCAKQLADAVNGLSQLQADPGSVEAARAQRDAAAEDLQTALEAVSRLEGERDAKEVVLRISTEDVVRKEEQERADRLRREDREERRRAELAEERLREEEAARKEVEAKLQEALAKRKKTGCCSVS
eukprot:TRINITY_DN7422_c0_g1_i2.p1 TRINITY_DN7422_c0_g1~~TRINITY_DN7422_c0_g1_i2.p1  ORF type:complete len:947 (+),score=365.96 TRINITY_DN7422_c0_g1_i2:293-3133(+)